METEQQPPTKIPRLSESEEERLTRILEERLEIHDSSRKVVQEKIHRLCDKLRTQIDELENKIINELEEKFNHEDNRLQTALNELRDNTNDNALKKAKAEVLVVQSYNLAERGHERKEKRETRWRKEKDDFYYDFSEEEEEEDDDDDFYGCILDIMSLCTLKTKRRFIPELMEVRKPENLCVTDISTGSVSVQFTCVTPDEQRILAEQDVEDMISYKCLIFNRKNEQEFEEYDLEKRGDNSFVFTPDILEAGSTYGISVRMIFRGKVGEWSDEAEFTTVDFKDCCAWKRCPKHVSRDKKYALSMVNPRIATKVSDSDRSFCTVIGNAPLPPKEVTSWNIKILGSREGNGHCIYVGVAPFDIDQNVSNYKKYGWYFDCFGSTLFSGPPYNYDGNKAYGPRREAGEYVRPGDNLGVVMDTTWGELSFIIDGRDCGVAYGDIPLDKPLVPCVILKYANDSVEFIL